MQKEIIPL